MLQTNLPSTSLRFEISKRLSCDASQSLLQFSSNSFSGGGLVEILRLVFKVLEHVQYDSLGDSVVYLPWCCHDES